MIILHLAMPGDITKSFFSFVERNLNCSGNVLLSKSNPVEWPQFHAVKNLSTMQAVRWIVDFFLYANKAEKIILHGLWELRVLLVLALNPWLLKRCYWVIWGGDLYQYKNKRNGFRSNFFEALRRFVIRRVGYMVTFVKGDVDLAREWYGATGSYQECFMYTSNIFRKLESPAKRDGATHIQVGNSADPSNNHLEIFEQLMKYSDRNIFIYAPLSYGDPKNALLIEEEGVRRFGERFVALKEMMPLEEYLQFLGKIDIAIFNHKRQQGMGNTISLLGLGKKVYLNPEVTPWETFKARGMKIYNSKDVSLDPMLLGESELNRKAIEEYFSMEKLIGQLKKILES